MTAAMADVYTTQRPPILGGFDLDETGDWWERSHSLIDTAAGVLHTVLDLVKRIWPALKWLWNKISH